MNNRRIVVALSGGVDSAVAAAMLQRQGCEVIGISMHLWCEDTNLQQAFQDHVVDYFCAEYSRGLTPNPCIACNQHLKFRLLLEKALSLDAQLATGHYARIERTPQGYRLLRARDTLKDQT
ncbi:MAG: mnmA, partial [Dehalococcoidia bacterium]|nr:mnmA [Dehalococcoidia bacterium]